MPEAALIPLLTGERMIWQGKPDPRKLFMPADAFLVPFHVLTLGAAVVFTAVAIGTGAPIFVLVSLSFVLLVGAYLTVGRFFVKTVRKTRTTYAVTDRRAIIHTPWSTREVRLNTAGTELITTGSGRHLTVIFSDPTLGAHRGPVLSQGWANEQFRNSGMEMLRGGHSPAFYDVADVAGLRAALESSIQQVQPDLGPPPYGT
jgi:hypothetical protein